MGGVSSGRVSSCRVTGMRALMALVLVTGAVAPTALVVSGASADPCPAPIIGPSSCAPTNVNFHTPGSTPIGGDQVCGIEGNYAPITTRTLDGAVDDPSALNTGAFNATTGTTEGNYPNATQFDFQPATALSPGQTITLSEPAPAEPYTPSGAIFPAASQSVRNFGINAVQTDSTVSTNLSFVGTNTQTDTAQITVQALYFGIPLAGYVVRLNKFNPYNPPHVDNGPGPSASDQTSANITGTTSGNTSTADGNGNATFTVSDGSNEDVVFGATVVSAGNIGVAQTATVHFGTGTAINNQSPCSGGSVVAPSAQTDGSSYILYDNGGVGHVLPASAVSVSFASGVETATLTIPSDARFVYGTNTVRLKVVDAVSPPGGGSGCSSQNQVTTPSCYLASQFSVATAEDPVPGYPGTAPIFNCCQAPFLSNNSLPVDAGHSTLNSSALQPQVTLDRGPTATATLRDQYNNPVSTKQVAVYQDPNFPASHANVSVSVPPSQQNPPAYPKTGNDGTVAYSVIDSCAETVHLAATDIDDPDPPKTFTLTDDHGNASQIDFQAAPSVAPDDPTHIRVLATCSRPSVISSITASNVNQPADASSAATVTVTLGDQFGNPDACVTGSCSPRTRAARTRSSRRWRRPTRARPTRICRATATPTASRSSQSPTARSRRSCSASRTPPSPRSGRRTRQPTRPTSRRCISRASTGIRPPWSRTAPRGCRPTANPRRR